MINERVLVLNDQGGGVINVTHDVTLTLRAQDHGHPPIVMTKTLVFNESTISCPTNGSVPKWNDACHTLDREAARAIVIIRKSNDEDICGEEIFQMARGRGERIAP